MKNIRLKVSYDGTNYHGFQTQPRGNTIQDHLEKAIFSLSKEEIKIIGSGRTDAGVHARAQNVNFHTESPIPAEKWRFALNSWLPKDIVVTASEEVPLSFHARKDAVAKTYCYHINLDTTVDVFFRNFELHHPRPLDLPAMQKAASFLTGTHDFTSFCSIHSTQISHVRTIYDLKLEEYERDGRKRIKLSVTGNGFLYNMVRIITGTLIEIGEGKMSADQIPDIIQAKDRDQAGPTAPAHGLCLWEVFYSDHESYSE